MKGDKGDIGSQGPQGMKGDIGSQGPQGMKGDKGNTGSRSSMKSCSTKTPMTFSIATDPTLPRYFDFNGNNSGNQGDANVIMPTAGTISNLYFEYYNLAGIQGNHNTYTCTILKDIGSVADNTDFTFDATSLTTSLTSSVTTIGSTMPTRVSSSNTADSVSVGDRIIVEINHSNITTVPVGSVWKVSVIFSQ